MSYNKIFISFGIGFLVGIFFSNILFSFNLIFYFLLFIMVFFIGLLVFVKKYHFFILILLSGIIFGGIYSGFNNLSIQKNRDFITSYYDKKVEIKAEIISLNKKTQNNISYISKLISINDKKSEINFLLTTGTNLKLDKGDIITLNPKVDKIDNFSSNFDYINYLLSKNIYFKVSFPDLKKEGKRELNFYEIYSYDFRQNIIKKIYNIFPQDEAGLLAGILVGARENISKEMNDNFSNSGLSHLMAVSGFNITIIIVFLGFLFRFFPSIIKFILITIFIIFFTLVVGDNVAVIRASFMGIISYFILISGRKADGLSLVIFTAFCLSLYNPMYLNYDVSFHLSFLAVLGLLYFSEPYTKIFKFLPKFFAIRESFVLTLSAMTTTLPIIIFNFGQISLLSPIANMLVGGFIPFAMLFGFLSVMISFLNSYFGFLVGYIAYFLLKFVNLVAEFFGNLDFGIIKFDFGDIGVFLEMIYFIILVFLLFYFKTENIKENKKD